MTLTPYVNFKGHCEEAFRYYEQHLGARVTMMMTHGEKPGPGGVDPGWTNKVLHARLAIAGTELQGADIPTAEPMRSAYLTLKVDSDSEAERVHAALAAGGTVFISMRETFFASRFAQLRDRFGINWVIMHERPTPPQA